MQIVPFMNKRRKRRVVLRLPSSQQIIGSEQCAIPLPASDTTGSVLANNGIRSSRDDLSIPNLLVPLRIWQGP